MSYKNDLEQNNADLQDILMTASNLPIYETIPMGLISLWYGAANAVPDGWALCDGTNGTPDLRDRFVVGAGSSYAVGAKGGSKTVTLTTAQMPSHSHSWYYNTYPQSNQGYPTVFSVWGEKVKLKKVE